MLLTSINMQYLYSHVYLHFHFYLVSCVCFFFGGIWNRDMKGSKLSLENCLPSVCIDSIYCGVGLYFSLLLNDFFSGQHTRLTNIECECILQFIYISVQRLENVNVFACPFFQSCRV